MTIECQMCGCENETAGKCFVCGSVIVAKFAVNLSPEQTAEADRLTRRYTALDTFAALVEAMGTPTAQKYAPSIYPNNYYRGRKIAGKVRLTAIIRSQGFKVFDGSRVA